MTIRDEALRTLHALADQTPGTARSASEARHPRGAQYPAPPIPHQPDRGALGRLQRELTVAVADPMVDRSRIEYLLAQVAGQGRRHRDEFMGGAAARLAVSTVLEVEGPQAAAELLPLWRAARDSAGLAAPGYPGCPAESEVQVRILTELGRYDAAAELLDESPPAALCCPEDNATLLGAALLPLLGAGQGLRALAWHAEGLRGVAHDRARLHLLADHMEFLRLTGNGSAAVELARIHAALLQAGATAAQRLRWLTVAAAVAAEQVDAGHGEDLVTVAWPAQTTEPMTLADFSQELHTRAVPLATAFDTRNGDRRRVTALADRGRHDGARAVFPLDLRAGSVAVEQRRRRSGRRPVTLRDVLASPDPYATAEEAVLSCTLVDPVGVWQELVLRSSGGPRRREAGARDVLARVLALAGERERCLAETALSEAMSTAIGDRVAVAAAKATTAAAKLFVEPHEGLALAQQAVDELDSMPDSVERAAAVCRARSAGVAALLALDMLDEAERWMAEINPTHPGQQVRVASQRALVLRRRGRLPEAADVLRAGARIADEHGLVALGVEIRVDLAEVLEAIGDTDGVVGALTRTLLDLPAVPQPDPFEVPRIRMDLARVLADSGRLAPARAELERARRELRAAPDALLELATVDYLLGIVLRGLRQLPAALTYFETASEAFAGLKRPDGVALAERDRGAVLFALDRGVEAAEAFDSAAGASRAASAQWHALACGIDAAQVRGYAGTPGAIEELRELRATLPLVAASGPDPGQAELAFQLARVDHALAHCVLATGEVAAAAELAEQALAGYRAAGADRAVAALSVDAGSWWWRAGDTGSALRYLRGAMRSARALGDGPLIARCTAALHKVGDRETDLAG
ncbi:MAG: hypothetical protein ACRDTG_16315 [Pseudonocardiaceae bacterium]